MERGSVVVVGLASLFPASRQRLFLCTVRYKADVVGVSTPAGPACVVFVDDGCFWVERKKKRSLACCKVACFVLAAKFVFFEMGDVFFGSFFASFFMVCCVQYYICTAVNVRRALFWVCAGNVAARSSFVRQRSFVVVFGGVASLCSAASSLAGESIEGLSFCFR